MRRTFALMTALALTTVLGACGAVGDVGLGGGGGDGPPTTRFPRPTTSTTSDPDPEPGPDGPEEPGEPGDPGGDCEEPPVWAFTVTTAQEPEPDRDDAPEESPNDSPDNSPDDEPPDDECVPTPEPGPTPEPELGTGDVQITLRWTSSADLDLHVFEPDGTEIYFADPGPTASGGRLDVDSNVGCEQGASVENVFWPEGEMPLGDFRVVVNGFQVDGCGGGEYTLTASVQGESVLDESGTVGEDEDDEFAFEAR